MEKIFSILGGKVFCWSGVAKMQKIIFPAFMLLLVSCASTPTIATKQIDAIVGGDILKDDHIVTISDKKIIKETMETAKKEIIASEKRADSNAAWASRGKWCAAGLALFGLFSLFKFFH